MSIVPMHRYSVLAAAEARLAGEGLPGALAELRKLTVDEFATVLYRVPAEFSALRSALPVYPAPEIQMAWTGNSDNLLVQKSALFSRLVDQLSRDHRGARLTGARILDYGCGWGRLLRQMMYFSDPDRLFGVDPWEKSLEQCDSLRVPGTILQVDYRPTTLPSAVSDIDLCYAFSVFTHIGQANSVEVLKYMRSAMAPGGLLVCTIRPVEYWRNRVPVLGEDTCSEMMARHRSGGFSFIPSGKIANAGSADYGEASCSIDTFATLAAGAGWRFVASEWLLIDPYQQIVCLQA